jgi:hypothetical protein
VARAVLIRPGSVIVALALGSAAGLGCARTLPPDPTVAALYRDLERDVTIAAASGWTIDRLEVDDLVDQALDSVCRVDPLARRALRGWLDEQLRARGGPVDEAWRRRGRKLGRVADLLVLHRIGLVLDHADAIAAADCPFWLEVEEPFRGRQISDHRWQITVGGGGKGMVVHQGERTDFSAGGAGRLLLGRTFTSRSALYAGVETGATAAFPKDELGNRGALKLGLDVVAPLVYRHTLTNAYVEGEVGWLGRTTEDELDRLDHGVHVGVSIGGRALRTRFFFPGAALGVSWERTFVDGADLTSLKLGARVAFDIDL